MAMVGVVMMVMFMVTRGCCSSGSRGGICETRPLPGSCAPSKIISSAPLARLRFLRFHLPGGRTAATHHNALSCVQSDQQMSASGGFLVPPRSSRALITPRRKHDSSGSPSTRSADAPFVALAKLGCIGCPNVSRWRASSSRGGVLLFAHPPLLLLLLLLPSPHLLCCCCTSRRRTTVLMFVLVENIRSGSIQILIQQMARRSRQERRHKTAHK